MRAPLQALRRHGFRRWYERQLIESHLWLVACVVAIILVACGIELLSLEAGLNDFAYDSGLIGLGLMLGWFGWRRYALQMMTAAFVGDQAVCGRCQHYGFRVDREAEDAWGAGGSVHSLAARCPKCEHRWRVIGPPRT